MACSSPPFSYVWTFWILPGYEKLLDHGVRDVDRINLGLRRATSFSERDV